jgi:hypothetical protein
VTVTSRRRRFVRAGLVATFLGSALAGAIAPAASASTAQVGHVRLAHLSPDTPDVDVYLDSVSSKMKEQVFPGVGYGTVSPYLTLPVGEYSVSMRLAGADPKTPPVLTTDASVAAGHAYTVAGVGRHADLGLRIFNDDLSSPANGKAKVRIIQASIKDPRLTVSMTDGERIGTNVSFATTTAYRQVDAGSFSIVVTPSGGGQSARLHVNLKPDTVYSLLILDGKTALAPDLKTDAAGAGHVPAGAVQTGLGGASTRSMPAVAVSVLAAAGLALGGLAMVARRRSTRLVAARLSGRPADRV